MNLYIDAGANTGQALVKMIPQYPGWHFFAFEPQPGLAEVVQDKIDQAFPEVICFVYPFALWIQSGEFPFYLATKWGGHYRSGSTLIQTMQNYTQPDFEHPIQVKALDFPRWIQVARRTYDRIVMKLDIEGAEYEVLEALDAQGLLPCFETMYVDWHYRMRVDVSQRRHVQVVKRLKQCGVQLEPWS